MYYTLGEGLVLQVIQLTWKEADTFSLLLTSMICILLLYIFRYKYEKFLNYNVLPFV